MIVEKKAYVNGVEQPCGDLSDDLERLRATDNGFLWIGLKDPTDAEFELVNAELQLHPLAVEDAMTGRNRAKIESYANAEFAVFKTLCYIEATSDTETGEVMVFVGDSFVVTVRRGEGNPLQGVRSRLRDAPERLALGPISVLHAVLDSVVDTYQSVDYEVLRDVEIMEQQVFDETGVESSAVYRLKREVLEFKRASVPLAESLSQFSVRSGTRYDAGIQPYFRDVLDHLRQINDHLESYDRLLTDLVSAHLAQVSVQQNADMRRISAWVAIAAVPTMIAGVYGMNFEHMPELVASVDIGGFEIYYGYYLILAVMATACVTLYRTFKRSGWL